MDKKTKLALGGSIILGGLLLFILSADKFGKKIDQKSENQESKKTMFFD